MAPLSVQNPLVHVAACVDPAQHTADQRVELGQPQRLLLSRLCAGVHRCPSGHAFSPPARPTSRLGCSRAVDQPIEPCSYTRSTERRSQLSLHRIAAEEAGKSFNSGAYECDPG
jgi:hypothetical protein